jgi:hypothetical protein
VGPGGGVREEVSGRRCPGGGVPGGGVPREEVSRTSGRRCLLGGGGRRCVGTRCLGRRWGGGVGRRCPGGGVKDFWEGRLAAYGGV